MELAPNYRLQNGKYQIITKIGQGGFGISYRAQWLTEVSGPVGKMNTAIPVAVKEFFFEEYCSRESGASLVSVTSATGGAIFEQFKNKLKKEAAILSRLQHPNIVKVLDIFEENNTAYMVMAFVDGESLKDIIRRKGKLDEAASLKYVGQLCDALAEIHRNKILHLDIKPGNILIDKNDNVQLIDFGISKQYNDIHQETSVTPIGVSKGFAPCEQYSGVQVFTPATDIYAAGATLYNMLTGVAPKESTVRIIENLDTVKLYNPKVSDGVNKAVSKAMEIKPKDRYQSAAAFWNALHADKKEESETNNETQIEPEKRKTNRQPLNETLADKKPADKQKPLTENKPDSKKAIMPDNINETDRMLLNIIRVAASKQSILAARKAQKKCFKICKKQGKRIDYKEHVQGLQLDFFPNEFLKSELAKKYENRIWRLVLARVLTLPMFNIAVIWCYYLYYGYDSYYDSYYGYYVFPCIIGIVIAGVITYSLFVIRKMKKIANQIKSYN
ncbi:MAG: serine/threonine protein kinase [Prevotellaceae bacterium]|jgi:serine/threonine protein kinase|nr:serine/threonine protein kinase [Prevotellaceae bacterium]